MVLNFNIQNLNCILYIEFLLRLTGGLLFTTHYTVDHYVHICLLRKGYRSHKKNLIGNFPQQPKRKKIINVFLVSLRLKNFKHFFKGKNKYIFLVELGQSLPPYPSPILRKNKLLSFLMTSLMSLTLPISRKQKPS